MACHCSDDKTCNCSSGKCESGKCEMKKDDSKPKPCCVCLDQKQARDECLLIHGESSGKCQDLISQYKVCMKGFGFSI
ncbi:DEKNAAC103390 [Brettanomyces naardenensis]|uniref:DEKNAAC103391 n=1 Tax=Brettanomyces naardenensis TaxID=13370 RepID=A0A448YN71_BRENA|nr:DEKNAAC103390 [Brettanomyces naardenensis]